MFLLKSDWESNTKKVEDIPSFPTGIYFPSSNQRFRCYGFLQDGGAAENCIPWQIAALKENKFWIVQVRFFPWVEYQKAGQLSQLSIGYLYSLIGPTV
jgi:hypothetical protein